jgi:hypothetical protein
MCHGLRFVRSMEEECKRQSFLVFSMPIKSVTSVVRARRKMMARRTTLQHLQSWIQGCRTGSASSDRWRFLMARFSASPKLRGMGGIITTCSLFRYPCCFQLSTDSMARKSRSKERVALHIVVLAHNLTQTQLTLLTYQSLRTMAHAII